MKFESVAKRWLSDHMRTTAQKPSPITPWVDDHQPALYDA